MPPLGETPLLEAGACGLIGLFCGAGLTPLGAPCLTCGAEGACGLTFTGLWPGAGCVPCGLTPFLNLFLSSIIVLQTIMRYWQEFIYFFSHAGARNLIIIFYHKEYLMANKKHQFWTKIYIVKHKQFAKTEPLVGKTKPFSRF